MTKPLKKTNRKSTLTPAKKRFAIEYAKTDNGTQAVKNAYGKDTYTELSARNKAYTLLTNPNVNNEIAIQKAKLENLANKAIVKIDELLDSDNQKIASSNAQFVINKVHPTITKTENTNLNINIEQLLNSLQ